jgi:sugar phosphate isomerase/epimerase
MENLLVRVTDEPPARAAIITERLLVADRPLPARPPGREDGAMRLRGARLVAAGRLAPDEPLGLGLWLPAEVSRAAVRDPAPLRERLAALGLRCFTVNAFPLADFHGPRVKERVFEPGWTEPARLAATLDAATVLAALLPEGATASLSTHSGAYRAWGPPRTDERAIAAGLLAAAEGLHALRERTGRRLVLALEPEPCSSLETTDEAIAFFTRHLLPHAAAREHLGLCFDACHQAVEFESLPGSLAALRRAGVPVAKVQLSSALALGDPHAHAALLAPWAEDRWFHQVVARARDGALHRLADLPDALAPHAPPAVREALEWRVHFHVPLFAERLDDHGLLRSTQPELLALLRSPELAHVAQLEIETYSFGMIPDARRAALGVPTLLDALERELTWVLDALPGASRP